MEPLSPKPVLSCAATGGPLASVLRDELRHVETEAQTLLRQHAARPAKAGAEDVRELEEQIGILKRGLLAVERL